MRAAQDASQYRLGSYDYLAKGSLAEWAARQAESDAEARGEMAITAGATCRLGSYDYLAKGSLAEFALGEGDPIRAHALDALRCLADGALNATPDGGLGKLAPATRRRLAAEFAAPASAEASAAVALLRADEREAAAAFFARDPDDPSDVDAYLRAAAAQLNMRAVVDDPRPVIRNLLRDVRTDDATNPLDRSLFRGRGRSILTRVVREGTVLPAVALWKVLAATAAPGGPAADRRLAARPGGHHNRSGVRLPRLRDFDFDGASILPEERVRELHAIRAARDPRALAELPARRRADADFVLAAAGVVPDDVRDPDADGSPYRFARALGGGDARALEYAHGALWLSDARFARAVFAADPRVADARRDVALVLHKGRAAGARLPALGALARAEAGGLGALVFAFCATAESYARDAAFVDPAQLVARNVALWTPWPKRRARARPAADADGPPPPVAAAAKVVAADDIETGAYLDGLESMLDALGSGGGVAPRTGWQPPGGAGVAPPASLARLLEMF